MKCWVFGHAVHSSAFMSSPSEPPQEACFELAGQPTALTSAKCSVSFAVARGAQYSRPTVTVRLRELRSCSRNSAHLSSARRPFSATCGARRGHQQGYTMLCKVNECLNAMQKRGADADNQAPALASDMDSRTMLCARGAAVLMSKFIVPAVNSKRSAAVSVA